MAEQLALDAPDEETIIALDGDDRPMRVSIAPSICTIFLRVTREGKTFRIPMKPGRAHAVAAALSTAATRLRRAGAA